MSLCLGHACIGSFSCFQEGTEAVDVRGDGYCQGHAAFIREELPNHSVCPVCSRIIWEDDGIGHWQCSDPNCYRCGGTGIDPVCIKE